MLTSRTISAKITSNITAILAQDTRRDYQEHYQDHEVHQAEQYEHHRGNLKPTLRRRYTTNAIMMSATIVGEASTNRASISSTLPSETCDDRWRNAGEKLGDPPGILWADELHKRAISAYSVAMSVHRQQVYRSMIRPVMCLLSDVIQAQSLW